jgi:predicted amidohydrolase
VRVAAVQLEIQLGDVGANLARCEALVREAAHTGAELVALPEFFTTGVVFDPALAGAALPFEGPATAMLARAAAETGSYVGGSFLCRDDDGEVRNAYALAAPGGRLLGRHDKDLPTMWENSFYVGGHDDGVIHAQGFTAGAAVCWELMRCRTARRLRGRVDLVVGGSNWWSIPDWRPRALFRRMERGNAATALRAPAVFGRYVGAPVVHGAICGEASCPMPDLPGLRYRGRLEGGALVADPSGRVLAVRRAAEGSGLALAEVEARRVPPAEPVPGRFWLHRRGALPAYAWHSQRLHGRRWYRGHVRGRVPARVPTPAPIEEHPKEPSRA